MAHRLHVKRQAATAPVTAPTGAGITNSAVTVSDTAAASTATGLAVDAGASTVTPVVTTPLFTPISTSTRSLESTPTPTPTESAGSTVGASSHSIALSTVIGACVGAFIGAGAFILLSVYFYRRYNQSLKRKGNRRAHPRSIFDDGRNTRGDLDRRRSKRESWNQLKDTDEDKWDGMHKTSPVTREVKEMDTLSPGVYRNAPSNAFPSASTEDSPRTAEFKLNHPYATATPPRMPAPKVEALPPPNMLAQIDSGPPISWASDSKTSFLSASRLSGGAMSPTLTMAIPTPAAVKSAPHHWESAEVVHYSEPQTAEIVDYGSSSPGLHNPFFNASAEYAVPSNHRLSTSSHARSDSNATIQQTTAVKEKERVVSIDPFRDPLPKPSFMHHYPSNSTSSSSSNDRAIRQLVAAASLDDLSEDEVQRRLRVASMQPSIVSCSGDSMYTDAEPDPVDDAMVKSFPIPPSSSGHGK